MFKRIKNYKIILFKDNNLNIREYSISKIFIASILSIVTILSLTIFFIYSTEIKEAFSFYEILRHQNNNTQLENKIIEQKEKINTLLDEINLLKKRDENLRSLLKLPSIDDDIRKLGTGGSDSIQSFNDLNYLLPGKTNLTSFERDLSFIERSINLEKISYQEIEIKLNEKKQYYLHYPAIYPVSLNDARRTSRYGKRTDPFTGIKRFHEGDDFSGDIGVPVVATANGVVKKAKWNGSFGKYIEIDHGYGFITVYGHLSKLNVKKGDKIIRGQLIGNIGNTGRSTAPHLHYEVQYKKKHKNPNKYYYNLNL